MPSKHTIEQAVKRHLEWYPNGGKAEVLADILHITEKEAEFLITEYSAPKPPPAKRTRKKAVPVLAEPPKPKPKVNSYMLLRWFTGFLGIIALVLSAYFGIDTLHNQLPAWVAWTMGATLITFAAVAFEVSVFLRRAKQKLWLVFGAMWLILMIFSATSIVSSLYNNFVLKGDTKKLAEVSSQVALQQYNNAEQEIKDLEARIGKAEALVAPYQKVLDELDTLEKQTTNRKRFDEAGWQVRNLTKTLKPLQEALVVEKVKRDKLLESNPTMLLVVDKKVSAYGWLGKLFGVEEDLVQFILQVIPALALDLIGSLSLYFFFFAPKQEE